MGGLDLLGVYGAALSTILAAIEAIGLLHRRRPLVVRGSQLCVVDPYFPEDVSHYIRAIVTNRGPIAIEVVDVGYVARELLDGRYRWSLPVEGLPRSVQPGAIETFQLGAWKDFCPAASNVRYLWVRDGSGREFKTGALNLEGADKHTVMGT